MKLSSIHTGLFKLDGGAMFGVVPKQMWERLNPPDERNMCTWAMRCLLIETGDKKILVDTGLGDKQGEKFRSHFEPHGTQSLMGSLKEHNLQAEDITDVFLTHLHFDHCGGAVKKDEDGELVPTFPNATYLASKSQYDWAYTPNPRERASFLKENFVPLQESGQLKFVEETEGFELWDGIKIRFANGHTESMMLLDIQIEGLNLFFCADLLPSSYHIGLPYVMSYDIRPLQTLTEKEKFLNEALDRKSILFFEHDPNVECCTLKRNERGRIVLDEVFNLKDVFVSK